MKKVDSVLFNEFVASLAKDNKKLTRSQEKAARLILNWPSRSGKSWLIQRLHQFDTTRAG